MTTSQGTDSAARRAAKAPEPTRERAPGLTGDEQVELLSQVMTLENLALYVWELVDLDDPAGMRVIYANEMCAQMFGMSVEELTKRTLREVFPRSDSNPRLADYKEVALGGAARAMGDVTVPGGLRGYQTVAVRVFPVAPRRMGIVYTDVTERRAVESSAVETLDAMSDALFVFDKDWRYTFVNSEAERVTSQTREALLGEVMWDKYPNMVGTMLDEVTHRAERERVTATGEQYFASLDMWISMRAHPTRDGVALFVQDITERKRIEERINQAQKMDAVAALAGGIAHDFNNALTAIRTAAELVHGDLEDGQARKDVEQIQTTAEHASVLTSQLLTIGRMRPASGGPTDVHAFIESLRDLFTALVGDGTTITLDLNAEEVWVDVDTDQLEQIMFNLILNARDAISSPGSLALSTKNVTAGSDPSRASTERTGTTYLELEVRDNGVGMDGEAAQRAFDPFFTTKESGTGLGLPSVYGIVTQNGGTMDLASEPGVGTTVTIRLASRNVAETAPIEPPSAPQVAGGNETILVVEDDDEVRQLVTRAIKRLGYTAISAPGGREALEIVHGGQTIDLLVTDVSMPHMSGAQLVAQLHATQPNLPVVYMSGFTANVVTRLAIESSTAKFVQKPFRIADLAEAIESSLVT